MNSCRTASPGKKTNKCQERQGLEGAGGGRSGRREEVVMTCICIDNWQNVPRTHHTSAHGGSTDVTAKMLD